MSEKTVHALMKDANFSEVEIAGFLQKLSQEVMGLTLMRISELFPQEERAALAALPEDKRGKVIAERAPQFLTREECREIEAEERQKRVDSFYKEIVAPRLTEEINV